MSVRILDCKTEPAQVGHACVVQMREEKKKRAIKMLTIFIFYSVYVAIRRFKMSDWFDY